METADKRNQKLKIWSPGSQIIDNLGLGFFCESSFFILALKNWKFFGLRILGTTWSLLKSTAGFGYVKPTKLKYFCF